MRPLHLFLCTSGVTFAGLILLAVEPAWRLFHPQPAALGSATAPVPWVAEPAASVRANLRRLANLGVRRDAPDLANDGTADAPVSREDIEEQWSLESRESPWADRMETRIRELLDDHALASVIPHGASCKSSLCKLEGTPGVSTQMIRLTQLQTELDLPVWIFAERDEQGEHPVFYLGRGE